MNRSQSPVVAEFEYMLPLCSVNASGVTTMASLKPWSGGQPIAALLKTWPVGP